MPQLSKALQEKLAAANGGVVPTLRITPPDIRQGGSFVAHSLARACMTLAAVNDIFSTCFVGAQGAEAALKAILHRHGVSVEYLRNRNKFGHDLAKLWDAARVKHPPLGDFPDWLEMLAGPHVEFQLRYADKYHGMSYPGAMKVAEGMRELVAHMDQALS